MAKKLLLIGFIIITFSAVFYVLRHKSHSTKQSAFLAAQWKPFIAQSNRFKVSFPITPQYARELTPIPLSDEKRIYEIYAAEDVNGSTFMISIITYPATVDTSDKDSMLRGIIDELVKSNPANKLVQLQEDTYGTHPALQFRLESNEFEVQGKTFLIDKTLYLLSYIYRTDDFIEEDYQRFINSFILNPRSFG